jgi:hypothetical protein
MYKQSFSKHCRMEWTEKADSGLSEEVLKWLFWNLTSRLDFSYGGLPWSLAIRPELARLLSSDNAHLSPSILSILSLELSSPNPKVTLRIIIQHCSLWLYYPRSKIQKYCSNRRWFLSIDTHTSIKRKWLWVLQHKSVWNWLRWISDPRC